MPRPGVAAEGPRITYLKVRNYRALRDVELKDLSRLTVFVGPNGSGKSTLFDVFAFLSECFNEGLRRAWDRRGRFKELRSRGAEGPIEIALKFKIPGVPLITYGLTIDEQNGQPIVTDERLSWTRGSRGRPFDFLSYSAGKGFAIKADQPDPDAEREHETLAAPDMLAVNTLGQFERHPRVKALREFITGWHLSYLSATDTRGTPEAGPHEHLSRSGDNLANVIQYLRERHPQTLASILARLTRRVPRLEKVSADILADGRLLLQIKDAPFSTPILARYASDGTLKLLSYLVLMNDPDPFPLIGIEEPENYLHPMLLHELAEECQTASAHSQLMVTTHSPQFLNALSPKQAWVLWRDQDGYAKATRTDQIEGIPEMMEAGGQLGALWMEGYFGMGDPAGGPG
ncbi:AAA family ATPase [Roseospira navarrensis]|uniref:AAA family ATPase n=1 Tax=Roseospira navarrensis TaxID=140058 RepID=A0A7X2D2F8_9PROT|nr:AAA family ATPase [Roseospira navarrensis]MQX35646.1 AAA family ATPase [Roseospira navarrensis]